MTDINFTGNLTSSPELSYTQSGLAVANFTVAVNRGKDDKQETDFYRCTVWREFAEHVAALDKGTRVVVTGNLKSRSYETQQGEKRTAWEVDVFSMGPDLRYATAQVTRTGSSRGGSPAVESGPDVWNQPTNGFDGFEETSPF